MNAFSIQRKLRINTVIFGFPKKGENASGEVNLYLGATY